MDFASCGDTTIAGSKGKNRLTLSLSFTSVRAKGGTLLMPLTRWRDEMDDSG